METPKITVNEALIIAKEYHLEAEVTECIKQGMSPIEALIEWDLISLQCVVQTCKHYLNSV